METAQATAVTTARDVLKAKQAIAAEQREKFFNLPLAERLAVKIIRQGLKGLDELPGLKKPDCADSVKSMQRRGLKRKAIVKALDIDAAEYSRALTYWKASLAERETVKSPSHYSIVGDIVNSAYLLWVESNYTRWQELCDKQAAKGLTLFPYTTLFRYRKSVV